MDDRALMEEDDLEEEEKDQAHEKMPEIFRGTQMTRDSKKKMTLLGSYDSPLMREMSEMDEVAAVHDDLEENMADLIVSKKAGFGKKGEDSEEMVELKEALMALVWMFSSKIPTDDKEFANGVREILDKYQRAITGANAYVSRITGAGKGKYFFGKKRLRLARTIQSQLSTEKRLFTASARALRDNPEEGKTYRWRDVLKDVRGKKVDMKGGNVEVVGAGASRIYKITDGDSVSFVKPEDRYVAASDIGAQVAMFRNTGTESAAFLNYLEEAGKKAVSKDTDTEGTDKHGEKTFMLAFYKNIKDTYKPRRTEKDSSGRQKSESEINADQWIYKRNKARNNACKSEMGKAIWDSISGDLLSEQKFVELGSFLKKKDTEAEAEERAGVEVGSSVSDRNVSSYRLARSLGVGNLIAKSETVILTDEFGRTIRANSMEGAKGVEFDDARLRAMKEGKTLTFTPETLNQFFMIRCLDIIAGQVDRHTGNLMVETEDDDDGETIRIVAIKGIDNDAAFGKLSPEAISRGAVTNLDDVIATYAQGFVGEEIITIRYIPETFYKAIMEYTDEMIDFDNVDLRTQEEIAALKTRLAYLRTTLTAMIAAGKLKLVKTAEEMQAAYNESRDYYERIDSKKYAMERGLNVPYMLKAVH